MKTFGFSIHQISRELDIDKQNVYDWFKGKRNIPKGRIEQLSKIPEFNHIDKSLFQKEVDRTVEFDIALSYIKYLSFRDSEEIVDNIVINEQSQPKLSGNMFTQILNEGDNRIVIKETDKSLEELVLTRDGRVGYRRSGEDTEYLHIDNINYAIKRLQDIKEHGQNYFNNDFWK